jgi:ABC-type transport system involved in multi-copper enzyme maturation permease subunit
MILHIAKREIYDNLNSLRFALTTVLLLALMLTNAVVHLREHPKRVQKYNDAVTAYQNRLVSYANESLYLLAQQGPGDLHKKPSPLHFCAEGGDSFLSGTINAGDPSVYSENLTGVWKLSYPSVTPNLENVRPDAIKLDWGFITGYVLSLVALLFTFDIISGERERGTLRLMLANSIPRHTVLIGKFLGALISISIPFTLSVLMNLLVISTASDVHLSMEAWNRLGIIFFIAIVYMSLFLVLGLLVSARVRQSAVSLVILLLAWVTLVVFMPKTLASIAGEISPSTSPREVWQRYRQLYKELDDKYQDQVFWSNELDQSTLIARNEYFTKQAALNERSNEERLIQQIDQFQYARATTRFSPVTIVQHLFEAFAGTGFERHLQFVQNAQRHTRQFREFIVDTDRADPESLHLIGVREGMSQKPVSPESVPRFEDTLNLSRDFNTAAMELLLLTLFVLVLLAGAYLAFVRVEV